MDAKETDFVDDPDIPDWAKGAVAALKAEELIEGRGHQQFAPLDFVTRAEAVTVMLNLLER